MLLLSTKVLTAAESGNAKAEWERTLAAARAEGQVVVYVWSMDAHVRAVREFQKSYPEIKLVEVAGTSAQLGPRLMAERRAEKFLADVFIAGTTTPKEVLLPAKALEPIRSALTLPEVKDESLWFAKKFFFADNEGAYVLLNDGTVDTSFLPTTRNW